jgi:hypothetical protein
MTLDWLLAAAVILGHAASVSVKTPPVDPFCISAKKRVELKAKYKEQIERPDCAAYLRKLRLARLECSDPQAIRDFKSAMLAAVNPDDAYAEGFSRALCPGRADAACMNPEPQCRLKSFHGEPKLPRGIPDDKFKSRLARYYLERLPDVDERQAQTMVDHYLELHGTH